MKKYFTAVLILSISIINFHACRKDKGTTDIDKQLYNEVMQADTTYYQNGNVLSGAAASPHGSFRLRFNSIAAGALDINGELPAGNTFPDGSLIVKEIISGGEISLYAVMKKDLSSNSAASGYLWAEYQTNGTVVFSAAKAGSGCIGCHSESPNRDLVRTFDFH